MSTVLASPSQLHFSMYPDPDVPPWLLARISWCRDALGANLELREGLSALSQLQAVAWAGSVLQRYLRSDGDGYTVQPEKFGPVLPDAA